MLLPSPQVVESMRLGYSPQDAVEDAIQRINMFYPNFGGHLVAVNADGEVGASSSGMDFTYLIARGMEEDYVVEVIDVQPVRRDLPPGLTGGKLLSGTVDTESEPNPYTISLANTHDSIILSVGVGVGAAVIVVGTLLQRFLSAKCGSTSRTRGAGFYEKLNSI